MLLSAALLAGSSMQCLFTEGINVPPEVRLTGPDVVHKRTAAELSAEVSDGNDNGASIGIQWFLRDVAEDRACPSSLGDAVTGSERQVDTGRTYQVMRDKVGSFCVWAVATDDEGAQGFAVRRYTVVNRAPVARMDMVAPARAGTTRTMPGEPTTVPLYTEVRLSGAMSEDADMDRNLRYLWTIVPSDATNEPRPCAGDPPIIDAGGVFETRDICRRLTETGIYRFELRVRDGESESEPQVMTVSAQADAPPCIERTEPPHDLAGASDGAPFISASAIEPLTFRVLEVKDDGDPFPSSGAPTLSAFVWRYREAPDGPFERFTSTSMSTLQFEAGRYRAGDQIEVRFEYQDRQQAAPTGCTEDKFQCASPPSSQCFQRVSWRVKFR